MTILNLVKKYFVIWLILLPGIICVPKVTAAFKYIHEGMAIPEVNGVNIYDNEKISSKQYFAEDNLVIVVFWATWAKRSIQELEDLKELSAEISDLPVKIIAVNVDGENLSSAMRDMIIGKANDMALPFPVIIDDNLDIFYQFGVIAVPSTAIVDTTGVIRYGPAGYSLTTRDLIEDSIKVLLGLKEVTADTVVKKGYKPNNKSSRYYNLALNLIHKRMYERALTNIHSSIDADPKFPSSYSLLGEIYIGLDSTKEAIAAYQKACDLDSTLVAAHAGLGKAFLSDKQLDSALSYLEKTLRIDDSYTPAFLDLGLTLAMMGRETEALDSLKNAQELNAKDPLPYYYMGQVYLKTNDTINATDAFRKALELLYPQR